MTEDAVQLIRNDLFEQLFNRLFEYVPSKDAWRYRGSRYFTSRERQELKDAVR